MLFVSPRFLFPTDSGGKIRTVQVLRGMKGGAFSITLASAAAPGDEERHASEIETVCDEFVAWPERPRGLAHQAMRAIAVASRLPVPVATDRSVAGRRAVAAQVDRGPDVVVFDFAHATVLAPPRVGPTTVLFTHNVESMIFERHAAIARGPAQRALWRSQWRKMERFEREALLRFDVVVAVSGQDATFFRERIGVKRVGVIPTGVDLDYFSWSAPQDGERVVFTGSMDWIANQDGIGHFLADVWPLIARDRPTASMCVVGRTPPESLVRRAAALPWTFTGFVDDVRPHVRASAAYVIPLRVGGGTRLKAFEAMALGCPVVSTTIGVEGLPLEHGEHYLRADEPAAFAEAVLRLLADRELRGRLSRAARTLVRERFSAECAGRAFERICLDALAARSHQHAPT
jgi:glycosyltransferase involved in cell wall biosynthesis